MLALALLVAPAAIPLPNLVLVTIDTLRADRVGAYGYAPAQTKTLDRLAQEGVLVEDVTVQVPETRPSHASILTGRYPYEHGIRDNYSPPLKPGLPTLASVLRARGYETAAFIGAYPISAVSGLDRGFDRYDDPFRPGAEASDQSRVERPAAEVVDAALAFLRKPRTRPLFLWVHLFDPHHPYEPPPPYDRQFAKRPYDGEVAYADAQLGRLVGQLDAAGLRSRTLVVVTSDHGEGLGDHGEDEHLLFVYDSTLRVPLVLSWPGVLPKGARVRGQFRSVDLMPTMLGLLGVPAPATSGASRAEVLRQGARLPDNESYVEALYGHLRFGYAPLRALRAEGWKYVDLPRPELYRLSEDPAEARNLIHERPGVATKMQDRLRTYDTAPGSVAAARAPVDAATRERLASLGYVDSGGARGGPASGADPKDVLEPFQAYRRDMFEAMRLYRRGDVDHALPLLTRLSRSETYSFNVQYFLGRSLLDKGRAEEAAQALERAVALDSSAGQVYLYLARAWGEAGDLDRALSVLDRGAKLEPRNPRFPREQARLLLQRGDAAARPAVDRALALNPKDGLARALLSTCLRMSGDLDRALVEAREATRLDARATEAWNALGLALGAAGKEGEAAEAFRSALALDHEEPDALFYLGAIELRAGRPQEAVARLEALDRKAPAYPGLPEVLAAARALAAPPPPGAIRLRLMRLASREEATRAEARLTAAEDFSAVARAVSIDKSAASGGDLGIVRPGELAEPLGSAAAALAPGALSPVLETPAGFVLLKREP